MIVALTTLQWILLPSFFWVKEATRRHKCGNVKSCFKCTTEVKEELLNLALEKEKRENSEMPNVAYDLSSDDEIQIPAAASNVKGKKNVAKKGPMDMFCRNPPSEISKRQKDKLRQANIKELCDKTLKADVHQYIARFWYQAGLSFNLVKLNSFQDMIDAIAAYGPNLPAPSYHDSRFPLLNKEMELTENLLKDHKSQWGRHGCSIVRCMD